MSLSAITWLVIGSASLLLLTVLTIGLARHVKLLYGSLKTFQDQVAPLAQDTAAEAERASSRAARLQGELPGAEGRTRR